MTYVNLDIFPMSKFTGAWDQAYRLVPGVRELAGGNGCLFGVGLYILPV